MKRSMYSLLSGAAALALAAMLGKFAQSQGAPGHWEFKAPLPSTWTEIVSVAVNGKLYAFDGAFPERADVEVYDPVTNAWEMRNPMPLAIDHIGTAVLNGKIYVVGGFAK